MTKSTEFSTIKDIYKFDYIENQKLACGKIVAMKIMAGNDMINIGLVGELNGEVTEVRKFNMRADDQGKLDKAIKQCINYIEDMHWLNHNVITYVNDRTLNAKLNLEA